MADSLRGGRLHSPAGIAALLGIAQTLAWATSFYLPAVLIPAVIDELGGDRTLIFGAFSLALLISGLAAPRTGRAIEARGGRPVLVLSSCIIAAGLVLLGLLPGLGGWFLGWIVLGLGMALGLYEAAFATLGMLFGRAARRPITFVTLYAGFASTIGWPMTAALVPLLGWRGTCLAYAGINLALVLPLYLLLPRAPAVVAAHEPGAAVATPPEEAPPPAAWARRTLLLLSAFFVLRAFISATFSVHVVALFGGLGLGIAAAVSVAALQGPSQVAGRILEFGIGNRAHPLTVARWGAALLPAGVLALLVLGPGAAAAFMIGYGASNGIMTISRGAVPLVLFGPRGYPTLMGKMALPILLAQAVAPMATAPVVAAVPAWMIFAGGGAMAVVAMACLLAVKPPPAVASRSPPGPR
ncbi:MAG: MFS transporter [Acetobacteraceae bacterium]|nr:MFS transporter [Acetobacteraceae bacterium]